PVEQRRQHASSNILIRAIPADYTSHAAAVDADIFIKKPFSSTRLLGAVEQILLGIQKERVRALRLAHTDRLASLGTLAAGVAHEINNPLTFILGNLEFLSAELRSIEGELPRERLREVLQALGEVGQGAERVKRIVRDLGVFTRTDEERRVPLELGPALEFAIRMTQHEIRPR